ncbi:subtilisin DY domain protein [Synechococcus sp. BIOS-E4-1]|uniref:S8 family serine peptidase n=1 Tax=Synechococcus sp. BIOS-E4-1 TaxID=1400864 RepID=UPI0016465939|nr:S8 family serine peptidase [Synechococcus sp. BIOS-E4-1]QNI56655.1 subtilisin DY domain protein [Synechococcus sp. BIOS-E4-1]
MSIESVQPGFFTSEHKSYQDFINTYFKNYDKTIGHYTSFEVTETTSLFAQLNDLPFDIDLYLGKIDESTGEPESTVKPLAPDIYNSSTNPNQEEESFFAQLEPGEYWLSLKINHEENQITWPTKDQQLKAFEFKVDGQIFNKTTKLSNDSLFNQQWYLFNRGVPDADISAQEGWNLAYDASNIQIAIIDTGVDVNHPDLIGNLWHNPDEIANNGNDDDGNGKADDIHGWNFITNTPNIVANKNTSHGTHVAGIAAAQGNNNLGITGVAWDAQLMTLDVENGDPLNAEDPNFYTHIVPEAIRYAVDNGADIINMSFGQRTKLSSDQYWAQKNIPLVEAFQHAYDNDVFITVAAGNEGEPYYNRDMWDGVGNLDRYFDVPASFSESFGNIASVASTNIQNDKASYSNFGQSISIAAPGGDGPHLETYILSTVPTNTGSIEDHYDYMAGTSQAAPLVAGMAALIRAQDAQITATETLAILRAGAQRNPRLMPYVNQGYQANLYDSLLLAQSWEGPNTLTKIGQESAPVMNLTALTTSQALTGQLTLSRDTEHDSVIGFYRVLDTNGTVLDALGNSIKPGDANYQSIALNAGNLVNGLTNLEINNEGSSLVDYSISSSIKGTYLAPYIISGDNTWFAWSEANSDGLNRFKVLGANRFGFEDQAGIAGEGDFNDLVLNFASQQIL